MIIKKKILFSYLGRCGDSKCWQGN